MLQKGSSIDVKQKIKHAGKIFQIAEKLEQSHQDFEKSKVLKLSLKGPLQAKVQGFDRRSSSGTVRFLVVKTNGSPRYFHKSQTQLYTWPLLAVEKGIAMAPQNYCLFRISCWEIHEEAFMNWNILFTKNSGTWLTDLVQLPPKTIENKGSILDISSSQSGLNNRCSMQAQRRQWEDVLVHVRPVWRPYYH